MADPQPFFYANAVDLAVSPYDATLRFARNVPDARQTQPGSGVSVSPAEPPKPVETFSVVMSPQHLKAMVPLVIKAIDEYERLLGPINIPADMKREYDALIAVKSPSK